MCIEGGHFFLEDISITSIASGRLAVSLSLAGKQQGNYLLILQGSASVSFEMPGGLCCQSIHLDKTAF